MRAAVIGLGAMGMGAALNLLKAPGIEVAGCDPRNAACDEFAAAGGTAVTRAADLPAGNEAALILVVNARQVEAAVFGPDGCAARLAPGAVLVVSATMAPDEARALAAQAEGAACSTSTPPSPAAPPGRARGR